MRYQKKSLVALGALLASSMSCVYAEEASNMPDVPPIYFDWQTVFVEDEPEMKKLTESPSFAPTTSSPTNAPVTSSPTKASITMSPTKAPVTMSPTKKPKNATARPTASSSPSLKPTSSPSVTHSSKPTETKSAHPTSSPSLLPTKTPSSSPTAKPSYSPSVTPSEKPSSSKSHQPTNSVKPTNVPTASPSYSPSFTPTVSPTMLPSMSPTHKPSSSPTTSQSPSSSPTLKPSDKPSNSPSNSPTKSPSSTPSFSPTAFPSTSPTMLPSLNPTHKPSSSPTTSQSPSSSPTLKPSDKPSNSPSVSPTKSPSSTPSFSPTAFPSTSPTKSPSSSPTVSVSPTSLPSDTPSQTPTVTNVESMTSKVILELDSFKSAMDDTKKETFENTAMKFIVDHINVNHENVAVNVTSVEVVRQLRSKGSSNGFIQIQDVPKEERKRSLQSNNEGLLVELLVTADVSYGSLPEDFSFAKTISPAFQQNFVEFESELDDAFSVYNQIQGEGNGFSDDKTVNGSTNLVVYISIACGVGGMVLATALLLVRRKRNALRIQEIRSQFTPSEDDSEFSEVDLSSPCEDVKVTQWDWRTNTAENIQKDLERGNPYIIPNVYSTKSQLSSLQYSLQSFDISSSENGTPSGSSTSSVSLGINVSPEAILEANKQNQSFSFIPQETGVSQSFPDKSGRLVYKSYAVEAPQGPLGIIIDTTPEGPMVHAIKPTSQLLGSIAPGDIIVGLDSVDTRQMTAPTLTRLMASKSQQVERKITLLRPMSN